MKKIAMMVAVAVAGLVGSVGAARADGCYICSSGSSDACKDYCRYTGDDTFDRRHECEKKGCKIGGTASCPTAVNYKVCLTQRAPKPWHGIDEDYAHLARTMR